MEEEMESDEGSDLGGAVKIFAKVEEVFRTENQVYYKDAEDSFQAALEFFDTAESKQFVRDYLRKIFGILDEKKMTTNCPFGKVRDKAVLLAVEIILRQEDKEFFSLLPLIIAVFTNKVANYSKNLRPKVSLKMVELGGFERLINVPMEVDSKSTILLQNGSLVELRVLLRALASLRDDSEKVSDIKTRFADKAVSLILTLTEDQLKRDTTRKNLDECFDYTMSLGVNISTCKFWMDMIVKMMKSATLMVKLFSWELLNRFIASAVDRRLVKRFLVKHAGFNQANGVYNLEYDSNDVCQWVKSGDAESELIEMVIALKNRPKVWYISSRETTYNKIVDFYSSIYTQEDFPPLVDWNVHGNGDASTPLPLVEPIEFTYVNGDTEEANLNNNLVQWAKDCKLVDEVFGSSMHRAIFQTSRTFLFFLADNNAFTVDDLTIIWNSGQSCDPDTAEEVFNTLAELSTHLNEEMLSNLCRLLLDSLKAPSSERDVSILPKIATFVKKLSLRHFLARRVESLLELIWAVFTCPGFSSLKDSTIVFKQMKVLFNLSSAKAIALQRIKECVDAFGGAANQAMPGVANDESRSSSLLVHTKFLLSLRYSGYIDDLQAIELPKVLMEEVRRFVQEFRKCLASDISSDTKESLSKRLLDRLLLLRAFYGICKEVDIPEKTLDNLWQLCQSDSLFFEPFFQFLVEGASSMKETDKSPPYLPMLNVDNSQISSIFDSYFCNEEIEWSKTTGSVVFESFEHFFKMVSSHAVEGISTGKGIKALWNIVKTISDESSAKKAMHCLLKVYAENPGGLLAITSSILEEIKLADGDNGVLNERQCLVVSRCVDILTEAVYWPTSMRQPASHASSGLMGRETIDVRSNRMQNGYNTIRKELKIGVHPTHSVKYFKDRIAAQTLSEYPVTVPVTVTFPFAPFKGVPDCHPLHLYLSLNAGAIITCLVKVDDVSAESEPAAQWSATGIEKTTSIAIGENQALFTSLLSFCDTLEDPAVKSKIWTLIMQLPTPQWFLRQVTTGAQRWSAILESPSSANVAYSLQIIDHVLQPFYDEQNEQTLESSKLFKEKFLKTGGFSLILSHLTTISSSEESIQTRKVALFVSLHILRFLLSSLPSEPGMKQELQSFSSVLVVKLFFAASEAAKNNEPSVVHDALSTISALSQCDLNSGDHIAGSSSLALVQYPDSQKFLQVLLNCSSKKVRCMSSEFAIELGKKQPVVFNWIISQIERVDSSICQESFGALNTLLGYYCLGESSSIDFQSLGVQLSDVLVDFVRNRKSLQKPLDRNALQGYLELLQILVENKSESILQTQLGSNFVNYFFDDFLFAFPGQDQNGPVGEALCQTKELRGAAFRTLGSFLAVSNVPFEQSLGKVEKLLALSQNLRHLWFQTVHDDVKKPDIELTGLKNQGCTCYMNSTLQQLFLTKSFRDAVLAIPIKETHRSSILHRADEELVGLELLMQEATAVPSILYRSKAVKSKANDVWLKVQVLAYNSSTRKHQLRYLDNSVLPDTEMDLRAKTFRFRLAPQAGDDTISSAQEDAIRVVEELQRTFCYMNFSKKRFFDPNHLVEACQSLKLEFLVTQQNDAAEFFDKLLDRIELVTKVKSPGTSHSFWDSMFFRQVFGSEVLYEKVPLKCEAFNRDRQECGHWQDKRNTTELKFQVEIKVIDKIYDALDAYYKPETMDGDNKVTCDTCQVKRGINRRAFLKTPPNTLVFHLKRFDTDFTTMATVKVNNRHEFPLRLNMLKYSKAADEKREGASGGSTVSPTRQASDGLAYEQEAETSPELDPLDYDYELQGVLIHAGVAGGGHYYSFARDPSSPETWYRLDDDEVTQFNMTPESVADYCYGGVYLKEGGYQETRSANALMLFYAKSRPKVDDLTYMDISNGTASEETEGPVSTDRLITGVDAFYKEVVESNNVHTVSQYLSDQDLHRFVRTAIESLICTHSASSGTSSELDGSNIASFSWSPSKLGRDLTLETIQTGVNFFLSIVLHFWERSEHEWISCLQKSFRIVPRAALWFVVQLTSKESIWLDDFLIRCNDVRAKNAFMSLAISAVQSVAAEATIDESEMLKFFEQDGESATNVAPTTPSRILAALVANCHARIFKAQATDDELFQFISRLASIAPLRRLFLHLKTLSALSYFFLCDSSQEEEQVISQPILQRFYDSHGANRRPFDFQNIIQSVLEAAAAILGVPHLPRAPLLVEESEAPGAVKQLTPMAKDAFSAIFHKYCPSSEGMSEADFWIYAGDSLTNRTKYYQRDVWRNHSSVNKPNVLTEEAFLRFKAVSISQNGFKEAWQELHKFEFRNDLTQLTENANNFSDDPINSEVDSDRVPPECLKCFSVFRIYFFASAFNLKALLFSVLRKICSISPEDSSRLLQKAHEYLADFPQQRYSQRNIAEEQTIAEVVKIVICATFDDQIKERIRTVVCSEAGYAGTIVKYNGGVAERFERYLKDLLAEPALEPLIRSLTSECEDLREVFLIFEDEENDDKFTRMQNSFEIVVAHAVIHQFNGIYHAKNDKEWKHISSTSPAFYIRLDGNETQWLMWFTSNMVIHNCYTAKATRENVHQSVYCPPSVGWVSCFEHDYGVSDMTVTLRQRGALDAPAEVGAGEEDDMLSEVGAGEEDDMLSEVDAGEEEEDDIESESDSTKGHARDGVEDMDEAN